MDGDRSMQPKEEEITEDIVSQPLMPMATPPIVLPDFDFRIPSPPLLGFVRPPPTYLSTNVGSFEPYSSRNLCLPPSIPNRNIMGGRSPG